MKAIIHQRKVERFTLLYALYRKTNGFSRQAVDLRTLANHEGINGRSLNSCFNYLCEEGFIRLHTSFENSWSSYYASLTILGVEAVEEVFRDEGADTLFFPSFREMMM